MIDAAHFAAGLLWVLGNAVWALGEFFTDEDEAYRLWDFDSKEAIVTARWWSSWILIWAFFPVIVLYLFWVPLSYMGKIPKPKPPPPRRISVRRKRRSTSANSLPSLPSYQQGTLGTGLEIEEGHGVGPSSPDEREGGGAGLFGYAQGGGYAGGDSFERTSLLSRADQDEF